MCPLGPKAGYTLIEILIGLAIITITAFAAGIFTVNAVNYRQAQHNILSLSTVRQQLVTMVENPLAWAYTIQNNASLSCFLNVTTPGANDCSAWSLANPATFPFPAGHNLKLYNSKNQLVFDSTVLGSNGLTLLGQPCSTYTSSPLGDPRCPLQPTISFRAVCPTAGACINPAVVVRVDFAIAAAQKLPSWLSKDRFGIEVFKLSDFCPPQAAVTSTLGPNTDFANSGGVPPTLLDGIVKSTSNALVGAMVTSDLNFCDKVEVRFKTTSIAGAPPRYNQVCLAYADTSCEYEWLEVYTPTPSWELRYNGAVVFTKPATTQFPPVTDMKFLVKDGTVFFYSDDVLQIFFPQPMTQNFRARLNPSNLAVSASINFFINSL